MKDSTSVTDAKTFSGAPAAPPSVAPASGRALPSTPSQPSTLSQVVQAIPAECHQPRSRTAVIYIGRSLAIYAATLALLAATDSWWLLPVLWVVASLAVTSLFILAHDAAHGALFPSHRMNRAVGRLLMAPAMHIYEAWVLGHNRVHHRHTLRQGIDFVWHPLTPSEYREMSRFRRLRHRLEWSWAGAGLYYLREVWWNKMVTFTPPGRHRRGIQRDRRFLYAVAAAVGALVFGLGSMSGGLAIGLWWVVKLLIVPWFGFLWTIGWAVHVHHIAPDIAWRGREDWNSYRAQVEGTTVYRLPRVLNLFFLNIFVHLPHHVDVRVPFFSLPAAAQAIEDAYPGLVQERRLSWRSYAANTRACKLYDFDQQRWLTYREAAA